MSGTSPGPAVAPSPGRTTRWSWSLVVAVPALAALVGYALGGGFGGSSDAAPSDDAVTVVGTATCTMESLGDRMQDGVTVIDERFSCELDLSDPRVSGTEELVSTSRVGDWSRGGTWTADAVLTSDEGTWRGSGWGVVSTAGNLPAGAAGLSPANFGEMHYEGEGAYEGLTFHYYFSGTNEVGGYSGWIEPGTDG